MPSAPPISPSDYYDAYPELAHRTGDIWIDLPTLGVLPISFLPGIVITPACDLQNHKVETLTYLPIVPVKQAFALRGFLPEVVRALDGQLTVIGLEGIAGSAFDRYVPLAPDMLQRVRERILEKSREKRSQKELIAIERAQAGVAILSKAHGRDVTSPTGNELRTLFGDTKFADVAQRIVTNAHRGDVHFLPTDLQPEDWTTISVPSIALFRYPLSAPIELFEAAQDTSIADWDAEVARLSNCMPCAESFRPKRPMKRLTLKPRFTADLVTRYVSMHVRLGAPDFTDDTVQAYALRIVE